MSNILYQVMKNINIEELDDSDKEELLLLFNLSMNTLLINQIAFIFSDLKFQKAVPYIIEKINQKELLGNNGSLVYALENLDVKDHIFSIVQMICRQEYESRLIAYGIVQQYANRIPESTKLAALEFLEKCKAPLQTELETGENSKLHFIEKTIELLS
ncbi:MAG: hypothetical protein C5B52_05090 [Bacteroidetes bacterium]|nr:MAG: hypothetical protein C5B52_05090 [Bacteroidota bacterium]